MGYRISHVSNNKARALFLSPRGGIAGEHLFGECARASGQIGQKRVVCLVWSGLVVAAIHRKKLESAQSRVQERPPPTHIRAAEPRHWFGTRLLKQDIHILASKY